MRYLQFQNSKHFKFGILNLFWIYGLVFGVYYLVMGENDRAVSSDIYYDS